MVNQEFVIHMLSSMGFPTPLLELIYEFIFTPTFSIMIDGRPGGFIPSNRGLRRGDPLSPYLFCIAMEFFTLLMEEGIVDRNLQPISNFQPAITHLLYADDVMIFLSTNIRYSNYMKMFLL